MDTHNISSGSDKAGIASAVLCTIHCVIVPTLFLMKFWLADENAGFQLPTWWGRLDYVFLLVSYIAVHHSASHTTVKGIKLSLWIFWAMLSIAILFEDKLHWMAYIASAGLITTHFINIRRIRKYSYST